MARIISRIAFLYGLLALASAAAGGCQRGSKWDLAPVEGTVTQGGRPLADIEVIFLPDAIAGAKGPRTTGFTDEAGRYHLCTDIGEDGALAGKYRVCIVDPLLEPGTPKDKWRVSLRYRNYKDTPLRAEVYPGPQTLDFDISR